MTDVQPNDPNRNPREAPDLDGDEVEAGRPVPATPYTLGVRAHRAALTAYLRSSRVRSRSSPERRATIGLTLCKSDAVRLVG